MLRQIMIKCQLICSYAKESDFEIAAEGQKALTYAHLVARMHDIIEEHVKHIRSFRGSLSIKGGSV